MEENNFTVYYHVFPNGKKYVGITCQDVMKRWNNGHGYYDQPVYNAIQKYGWDNIEHNIYKQNLTKEEANKIEKELIQKWNTLIIFGNGYNVSTADYYNNADVFKKQVSQYDIKGNLINTFNSIKEATTAVGASSSSTIGECCKGYYSLSNGFQWRFGCEPEIEPLYNLNNRVLKIDQFDLNGNYIQTFNSAMEAGRMYSDANRSGIHIVEACNGTRRTAFGFQWRYSYKNNNDCIKVPPKEKEVSVYNLMGELLQTFCSINEAARQYNVDKLTVSSQCNGKKKTTNYDFFFKFGHKLKIEPMEKYVDKLKRNLYCYNIKTREFVKEYESSASAALELTGKKITGNIASAVAGKRNNAHGYIWSYIKWDITPENYRELNYQNYLKSKNNQNKGEIRENDISN